MATLTDLYDDVVRAVIKQMKEIRMILRFAQTCRRFRALVNDLWPTLINQASYFGYRNKRYQHFIFYEFIVYVSSGTFRGINDLIEDTQLVYEPENYVNSSTVNKFHAAFGICYNFVTVLCRCRIGYDETFRIIWKDGAQNRPKMVGFVDSVLSRARVAPEIVELLRAAILFT